ncbi:hypothetical protein ACHAXT_012151 [Thalassiosira profunda]
MHQPQNTAQPSGLTEEQRARMEERRRIALEKKQQQKAQHSAPAPIPESTMQSQSSNTHLAHTNQGEMGVRGGMNAGGNNSQQLIMTDEQRARMEENRLRALEKKKQKSAVAVGHQGNGAEALAQGRIAQPVGMTEEQRMRVSQNRLRALEKKQQQQQSAITNHEPANGQAANPQPSGMTNDQRAKMEANRLNALAKKKQQMEQPLASSPSKSATHCPSVENNQQFAQPASSQTAAKPPARSLSPDLRARMERNRQMALEKKQQRLLLSQQPSGAEGPAEVNKIQSVQMSCIGEQPPMQQNASTTVEGKSIDGMENRNAAAASAEESQRDVVTDEKLSEAPSDSAAKMSPSRNAASTSAPDSPDDSKQPPSSPTKSAAKKSGLPPIPPELQYEQSRVLPINDDDIDPLIENAELDEPLLNGWTLYDHQKEGVLRALRMRRLILAFDMGLGKTIIGCVWAKAFQKVFPGLRVFVIAPVTLHEDWRRTATEATGLNVESSNKKKTKAKPKKERKKDSGKTVTGKRKRRKRVDTDSEGEEEEVDDDCDEATANVHIYSWQKVNAYKEVVANTRDYVVIADEAHSMQSMTSGRTKDALKLMFPKKCRGVLLLSGTPMKNGKPSNLFPLLKAVRHPFGDEQKRYEFYFCNGQTRLMRGKEVWDASGSSNLKELNAHTASHIFRMTKEEALELPPRKRELRSIPIPPRYELRYTEALKDLAHAVSLGEEDILTPLQTLRKVSSDAKVGAVAALANTILVEESSIVIFSFFVPVAKAIYARLNEMGWEGELLCGETPAKKRQDMVDRFQSGLSPVFVCTYGAGGVGLTLTAACTVILVDRPWTPGDVCQAEDRVRRIGQKRPVRSIWVRAFPLDEQIDDLIDHKEDTSSTVVDGKEGKGGQSRAAPKISVAKLVKSLLSDGK